jgi:DNA-binding CsgD family transcriptional regulator
MPYRTKGIKEPDKQIAIRMFGYVFFICQTIFILTSNYSSKLLFSFAYILPPLIYLRRFLKKYFREYSSILENEANASYIFSKYNISQRELELIYLICKGKSNKEIGDTLYISLQTVKHHIHSIYRKLNTKNRVQLSNFFNNISRGTMGDSA